MILQSLKLENIRSYLDETIEFPEKSVMLSGDIGSGKSTVLLAVEFALFGIMRAELSGDSLLRHGKNQGSVELKFEIENNEYIIKRTLKRSKDSVVQDSGFIITNGRKFDGTPVELKAKIIGILGYPEELVSRSKSLIYRYTVYTPQEEMKQILFEDRDIRLDTLRKLFGIDKYKAIRENAVLFIREVKRRQQELKSKTGIYEELAAEKDEKSKKLTSVEEQIAYASNEIEKARVSASKAKRDIEALEEEIRRINEARKNFEVLNAGVAGKKNMLDSIKKRMDEERYNIELINKKLIEYSKITGIMQEKDTEREADSLTGYIEKLKLVAGQISAVEKDIMDMAESTKGSIMLEAEISDLGLQVSAKGDQEKMLDDLKDKERRLFSGIEKCTFNILSSEEIIKNIGDLKICPTCGQSVDDRHRKETMDKEKGNVTSEKEERTRLEKMKLKVVENIEKIKRNIERINAAEGLLNNKREQLAKIQESSKHIVRKQKELSELYSRKKSIEEKAGCDDLGKLAEKKDAALKQLAAIRDNNLSFREKSNLAESRENSSKKIEIMEKEFQRYKSETDELIRKRDDFGKSLEGSEKSEQEFKASKMRHEKLLDDLKRKEIMSASLSQEKEAVAARISDIEKKLSSLEKMRKEINYLSEIELWFDEFFMNLMVTMEKHVMVSIHKEFESLFREWLSVLIDDVEASLDDEFSARIIQDGYDTPLESLSGGEKTSVALAYRLALNKVINDLIPTIKTKGFIILDEPTDGFSSEQLDKVRDVLNELGMKQTIIVSHEPKMESMVEHIIKISKADGISYALIDHGRD